MSPSNSRRPSKKQFRALNGVLLLDKARDVSSNKALQRARFLFRAKKAGHTGTLDPFATGLLPICFGEANKYSRWLLDADKTYQFTAVLGQYSSTGDTEGDITVVDANPRVSDSQLRQAEIAFLGQISQIPPKFSALKVNGQRAYDLARKGAHFELPKRQVFIHRLTLALQGNCLVGRVCVTKGTYIRTLVEDIAKYLGTVAYCQTLRRLQVGNLYDTYDAAVNSNTAVDSEVVNKCSTSTEAVTMTMYTLDALQAIDSADVRNQCLLPIDVLCQQFSKQKILPTHWQMLIRGRQAAIDSVQNGKVRLYLDDVFCGLGEIDQGQLKAFRLINTGFC